MEIAITIAAAVVVLIIIVCIGYVKSPPDTAYLISGFRKPRILIGKAGIRIPVEFGEYQAYQMEFVMKQA